MLEEPALMTRIGSRIVIQSTIQSTSLPASATAIRWAWA